MRDFIYTRILMSRIANFIDASRELYRCEPRIELGVGSRDIDCMSAREIKSFTQFVAVNFMSCRGANRIRRLSISPRQMAASSNSTPLRVRHTASPPR